MRMIKLNLVDGRGLEFDRDIFVEARKVYVWSKKHKAAAKAVITLKHKHECGDVLFFLVKETKEQIEKMIAEADKLELSGKINAQTLTE